MFAWLGIGIQAEVVLDRLPRDTTHVRRLPGEDVPIGAEEVDDCVFLFGVDVCPNDRRLGGVAGAEVDGLGGDFIGGFHGLHDGLLGGDL